MTHLLKNPRRDHHPTNGLTRELPSFGLTAAGRLFFSLSHAVAPHIFPPIQQGAPPRRRASLTTPALTSPAAALTALPPPSEAAGEPFPRRGGWTRILSSLRARNGKLQLAGFLLAIVSVWLVYFQLRENNKTNRVAIRGQLYERESAMAEDEATDDAKAFGTVWALPPPQTPAEERTRAHLSPITTDETALSSRSPAEVHRSLFDLAVFSDVPRRDATQDLRRLFLYTQTSYYHVHNTFDYQRDGIISDAEWRTWKGLLREMHAHPLLLTVIWHSHQNHYISRPFARFLQAELCPDAIPPDVADVEAFKRDREFVRMFYPEMTRKDWADGLPDY